MRKLIIERDVEEKILNIQTAHSFKKEIGGILVGTYDAEIRGMRLTDISYPFEGDKQSQFHFYRKSDGHQELMDQLWEKSNHTKAYLGEWHTHDQKVPIPSKTDCDTWKRITKNNNNFDESYFMIIGRTEFIIWAASGSDIVEVYRGNNNGKK